MSIKCIKCKSYEELQEVVGNFFKSPEAIEDLTQEQWESWLPVYVYCDGAEVLFTESLGDKGFEVTKELYHLDLKPYKNTRVIVVDETCTPEELRSLLPRALTKVKTLYHFDDSVVTDKYEILPAKCIATFTPSHNLDVCRGGICKLKDWVEPYKDILCVGSEDLVFLRYSDDSKAVLQIRGTKKIVEISPTFLEHIGDVVKFKIPTAPSKYVDNQEYVEEIKEFYKKVGATTPTMGLFDEISNAYPKKMEYLSYIFNGNVTHRLGSTKDDVHVIIKHHPRFKEMLNDLESLGIPTKECMEGILDNVLVINGKRKKVTGFIQTNLKKRYDDVYTYPQEVFPDETVISIDPLEFASASANVEEKGRSGDLRSSCFYPTNSYHASVWGYYTSKQTAIIKIKNDKGQQFFRTWCAFDNTNFGIMFGRKYGTISDTQMKIIRYILEYKMAKSLDIINSWKCYSDSCSNHINVSYDRDNTYWDSPRYICMNRLSGSNSMSLKLETGLTYDGSASRNGEFCGERECEECHDNFDEEYMTYLGIYDTWVCDDCLNEYYCWSNRWDTYIARNESISIIDTGDYDYECNAGNYYEIDGDYYKELPDDYVEDVNGNYIRLEDCTYCEVSGDYYETYGNCFVTLQNPNGTLTCHEDNIPSGYVFCEECGTYELNELTCTCSAF